MKQARVRSPLTWLGGLLVVYLAVPVLAFLVRFGGSHDRGFATPGLWGAVRVSVLSASLSTVIIAGLGIPLAYALARSRGRISGLIGVVVQLPLALPPLMGGILLIYLFGPYTTLGRLFGQRLTDSLTGIVLAQTFVSAPFLVIAARSAFASLDPALDEVAATLGHRPLARFLRVSLPAAAAGISAGMLLAWLRSFGEYGATVLLAYHPFSLPVYTEFQFGGTGLGVTEAPTFIALAIAAVAVTVSHQRRPRRVRTEASLPVPRPPALAEPTPVAFDLDLTVGSFRLAVAHRSASHRLAILGPSGSGKSIMLRSLAGLLGPDVGTVCYGPQSMESVPTERRGIGYVPQSSGLFPHRRVWQQMTFGTGADEAVASWWLDTLQLHGLHNRLPTELSGGQRRRVGLAQALATSPRVVFLDEPFSGLDAPVREELRRHVRRLQCETGLSTVLVTHDPEEAALLADEILVIADGRLLQAGPRPQVYAHPATPQVARVLGMQNLNRARAISETGIATGALTIATAPHGLAPGTDVLWCVRPEHIDLSRAASPSCYPAGIVDVADLGAMTAVTVRLDEVTELLVRAIRPGPLEAGGWCGLQIDPAAIMVWPAATDVAAEGHDHGAPPAVPTIWPDISAPYP